MFEQVSLPLAGGWGNIEDCIPMTFRGRRFHPLSEAPEGLAEGGCFDYSKAPTIFLGRRGWGPLRVAWDTDILIDWRDFGSLLLSDDEDLPHGLDRSHSEDLVALGSIMNTIWLVRDIRIRPLKKQLEDLGRLRDTAGGHARRTERRRQLDELAAALTCVGLGEPDPDEVHLDVEWHAPFMRPSVDRTLVEEALASGCHVFLTRDKKVLAHTERLMTLGLRVQRPSELLDEFCFAGLILRPFGPDGLACDTHKWHHLYEAIGTPTA